MGSIKSIVSEPIEGNEEYHIMVGYLSYFMPRWRFEINLALLIQQANSAKHAIQMCSNMFMSTVVIVIG